MDLNKAAGALRDWAVGRSLPLWAAAGFDPSSHRFVERLTLAGTPDASAPIRLIVQARQVYSFSVAARHGWHHRARDLVEQGFAAMLDRKSTRLNSSH